jgi:hypothetical protein
MVLPWLMASDRHGLRLLFLLCYMKQGPENNSNMLPDTVFIFSTLSADQALCSIRRVHSQKVALN